MDSQSFGECTARVKLELTDFNVFVKMSILYCFNETYLTLHGLVTNNFLVNYQMLNKQSLIDSFNYALPILHGFPMNYPLVLSFQIGRGELSFTKVTGVRQ